MGRSPESVKIRGGSLRTIAYPRVTPGLPSELLAQRPDIREAEANLAAADANVVNARAQFLPSISLTGEGGYESAILKLLLRPESGRFTRPPQASRSRSSMAASCSEISICKRASRTNCCRFIARR